MKYIGYFKNINDKLRRVEITTPVGNEEVEITLSASPFTVSYTSEQKNLYKPVKYSGGNVGIVADEYYFDIFSSKGQDVSVKLFDENNNVLWTGYITPALYNQSYEFETENFDVEIIDGLSTLQYLDYVPVKETRGLQTFGDIILSSVKRCNCYSKVYFQNFLSHKQDMQTGYDDFIQQILCNENTFFEDDDDLTKAIKTDEVLTRLLQYLNMTMFAWKDNVYVINYDALNADISEFNGYDIKDKITYIGKENIDLSPYIITSDSYMANGGQISLTPQYNKVRVITEPDNADTILPSIFDEKYIRGKSIPGQIGNVIYNLKREIEYVDGSCYASQIQKEHRFFKPYFYNKDLMPEKNPYPLNEIPQEQTIGAYLLENRTDKKRSYQEKFKELGGQNYLLLALHNKYSAEQLPLYSMEMPPDMLNNIVVGGQTKLVLSGSLYVVDKASKNYTSKPPFSVKGDCSFLPPSDYKRKEDDVYESDDFALRMRIKAGNMYFNGKTWQTEMTDCKIPLTVAQDEDYHMDVKEIVSTGEIKWYKKWKHFLNQELKIKNTVANYTTNLDGTITENQTQYNSEGFLIDLPDDFLQINNLKIEFLLPEKQFNEKYSMHYIWIRNFEVKAVSPVQWETKKDASGNWKDVDEIEDDSSTVYENVINEDFAEELEDIKFKVHTDDNKKPNFSSVVFSNYNRPQFLDKIYNSATKQYLRAEEQTIYAIVNQYQYPAKVLEITLKNKFAPYNLLYDSNLNNKFIIDEMEIDYFWDSVSLKLIEKK